MLPRTAVSAIAAALTLGACGGSSGGETSSAAGGTSGGADGSVASGSGAPGTGGASTAGASGDGGNITSAGGTPGDGGAPSTGGASASGGGPPLPSNTGGSPPLPDSGASTGGASTTDAGSGGSGGFATWTDACELATALVRLQIDQHHSFGSICIRMVITHGLTSDARYAVTLPEGWGVQAIAFFEDVDCTTPSPTIAVTGATGAVTWDGPAASVPETLDIDVGVTTTSGTGRPGSFILHGSGVAVGSCG